MEIKCCSTVLVRSSSQDFHLYIPSHSLSLSLCSKWTEGLGKRALFSLHELLQEVVCYQAASAEGRQKREEIWDHIGKPQNHTVQKVWSTERQSHQHFSPPPSVGCLPKTRGKAFSKTPPEWFYQQGPHKRSTVTLRLSALPP